DETDIDAARHVGGSRITGDIVELGERFEQTENGAEQPDERRGVRDAVENAEVALKPRHFELAGLLHDFAEVLARGVMTEQRGGAMRRPRTRFRWRSQNTRTERDYEARVMPRRYLISEFPALFCATCAARHAAFAIFSSVNESSSSDRAAVNLKNEPSVGTDR